MKLKGFVLAFAFLFWTGSVSYAIEENIPKIDDVDNKKEEIYIDNATYKMYKKPKIV